MPQNTPSYNHGYRDGISYGKGQSDAVLLEEMVKENFACSNNEDYAQGFADGAHAAYKPSR